MASRLLDLVRAVVPVADRVLASVDRTIGSAERLGAAAIRYGVEQPTEYARKPPTTVLSQIQPINVSAWDLSTVKEALEQHELGFFMQSVSLADAMGRDDRITACRNTRVRALAGKSGIGFTLTPSASGKPATSLDLAAEVTELWPYSCSESALTRVLEDAVMLGVAFARIHWEKRDGRVVPRLEPWFPQSVYYDWSIRKYRAIGIEGQVIIEPGSAEWLVFEPGNYRSWMGGAIRGLGIPWLYRQFSRNDWSRYCEKHGLPIIAISEPAGHQWTTQKDRFYAGIRAIGRQGIIRLPRDAEDYGFDVKFVEPKDKSWAAFQEFIVRMDTDIAVMLLGQNLTTEVQGGSYAAAAAHEKVRLDYLDADAETLATALREQVWKPYVRFNHGADLEDSTPWPTWMTRPPEDRKARIEIVKVYVDIGKNLADANTYTMAPVDMRALATDMDITVTAPVEEEDSAEEAPVAGEAKPEIFAYHYQYGLIRKNEGREFIGLPPVSAEEGGNDFAAPAAQQGGGEAMSIVALKTNASEATKAKARHEVEYLIRSGKIPPPSKVKCADCGHLGSDKEHSYDHHKGYSGENSAEVEAVCVDCHRVRDGQNLPPEKATAKPKRKPAKASVAALSVTPWPERTFAGGRLRVQIDRPKGTVQRGIAPDGTPWERTYLVDYGYLSGTRGGDGDELDVYCGDDATATTCFVIAQIDDQGRPDEYKLGLGYSSAESFKASYLAHTPARYFGGLAAVSVELIVALRGGNPVATLAVLGAFVEPVQPSITMLSGFTPVTAELSSGANPDVATTAYVAFSQHTNMSEVAMSTWAAGLTGKASVKAARTLRLLRTPVAQWDAADVKAAQKAAKALSRLRAMPANAKRDESLKLYGHDPSVVEIPTASVLANAIRQGVRGSIYVGRLHGYVKPATVLSLPRE